MHRHWRRGMNEEEQGDGERLDSQRGIFGEAFASRNGSRTWKVHIRRTGQSISVYRLQRSILEVVISIRNEECVLKAGYEI